MICFFFLLGFIKFSCEVVIIFKIKIIKIVNYGIGYVILIVFNYFFNE